MNESDARVELGFSSPGHSDQNHSDFSGIECGADLFEAGHPKEPLLCKGDDFVPTDVMIVDAGRPE
jgi:hypothetical protein